MEVRKVFLSAGAMLLIGCTQPTPPAATPTPAGMTRVSATPSAPGTPGHRGRGEGRRRMRENLDADKDGKLTDAEIEAGYSRMLERSQHFQERVDKDGDGKISEKERRAGLERFKSRMKRGPSHSPSPGESPE